MNTVTMGINIMGINIMDISIKDINIKDINIILVVLMGRNIKSNLNNTSRNCTSSNKKIDNFIGCK
jgi:hypothetical protein